MVDNKRKNTIAIFFVIGAISLLVGVSYSFFNYTRTGAINNLGTGRIHFYSNQSGALNMTNLFPITSSEVNDANLDTVTVEIIGDTTYTGGEEFEISLVDVNNFINGKKIPVSYIATYTATTGKTIGTSDNNYWESRELKNASIYTLNETGNVYDGKQVLVGYIDNGATGISGTLTIKAYLDADRIAISDTYDGSEDDNYGTTNEWVNGRVMFTTSEWNSLNSTPVSFKIRAESNEGIWVNNNDQESLFLTSLVFSYNPNRTTADINNCVNYLPSVWDENDVEDFNDFCNGTIAENIVYANELPDDALDVYYELSNMNIYNVELAILDYDKLGESDVVIPSMMPYERYHYN